MLKEILDWMSQVKRRFLLTVFFVLTLMTFFPEDSPLDDPISPISLLIPLLMGIADVMTIVWFRLVERLNSRLAEHDLANWGVFLGGSGLVYCLCIVFWYFSNTPEPLNLRILSEPGFIRLLTLYLLSVETMGVSRRTMLAIRG